MSDRRAGTAAKRTEDAMLRAYRVWFEHVLRCADCKRAGTARDGCEEGRDMWGDYRLARIGSSL
jgi:hypothetical protein